MSECLLYSWINLDFVSISYLSLIWTVTLTRVSRAARHTLLIPLTTCRSRASWWVTASIKASAHDQLTRMIYRCPLPLKAAVTPDPPSHTYIVCTNRKRSISPPRLQLLTLLHSIGRSASSQVGCKSVKDVGRDKSARDCCHAWIIVQENKNGWKLWLICSNFSPHVWVPQQPMLCLQRGCDSSEVSAAIL